MQIALQVSGWLIGLPLQLLLIAALLRGAFRRFPFFFVYIIAGFLATVIEISVYLAYYSGVEGAREARVFWYWLDEGILQVLVFAAVISIIDRVDTPMRLRRVIRFGLAGASIAVAAVSILTHYATNLPLSAWMTPCARDLNFCAAILDFALWSLLLARRERDRRLLALSGGLGIQFTGEAVGQALRHLSPAIVMAGNVLIMAANLVVLYLWWQVFRREGRTASEQAAK